MTFSKEADPGNWLSNDASTIEDSDNLDPEGWLSNNLEATEESESKDIENVSTLPFDPKSIKITVETITVYNIAQRLKSNRIDLYPEFQRKANLWDDVRKSRLIESILLRFPLPAFYFDIENEDFWLVVDGLQRLSTLKHFIVETGDPLKLTGLEILKDLNTKSFKQLDITLRQRILETNITTFQIQAGTPKELKYNVFNRINTGGLPLSPMEIRHALNQKGIATKFFKQLSGTNDSFFNAFIRENKIPTPRMEDRELLLRYVAFSLQKYEDYTPSLGKFLDTAMQNLDLTAIEIYDALIINLEKAITCYKAIFGNTRFGRGFTLRAKMNSALFEVWTTELARLSDKQREQLVAKKDSIKAEYQTLLGDANFKKSIVSSTAGKGAVETRFRSIRELLKNNLQ